MKVDKNGIVRINLSFNTNDSKDGKIIEFLESKYSESAYIKETLYALATGKNIGCENIVNNVLPQQMEQDPQDIEEIEEFEEVKLPSDFEL